MDKDRAATIDHVIGRNMRRVREEFATPPATLNDVEMALPGERDPMWRLPRADLTGITFDLGARDPFGEGRLK